VACRHLQQRAPPADSETESACQPAHPFDPWSVSPSAPGSPIEGRNGSSADTLLWQSMHALEAHKRAKVSQTQGSGEVYWSVDLQLGTRTSSASPGAAHQSEQPSGVRSTDGLMLQLWDSLDPHQSMSVSGAHDDAAQPFAVCVVVEEAHVTVQGTNACVGDTEAKIHGAQAVHCLLVSVIPGRHRCTTTHSR
jgi:hypothetical protein